MAGEVLIVGAGYLGRVVARSLLAQGERVCLTTRDPRRARDLAQSLGVACEPLDLADPDSAPRLAALAARAASALFLLPPSGCVDAGGSLQPFLAACEALAGVPRAVLSSSTAVYGDHAGAVVEAETPCRTAGERGARLLAIEQAWLAHRGRALVRLAGLYGPGRVIGQAGLLADTPVAGDPDGWLNLLHVEDAASLLLACLHAKSAANIELGSDGRPCTRRDYYHHLAARLDRPSPRFSGGENVRGAGSRRCDPASTRRRIGWYPMYSDFRAGLAQALPVAAPHSKMNCP